MEPPKLIANRNLTLAQVPPANVTDLDPVNWTGGEPSGHPGRSDAAWARLWTFALTYDGYAYFGDDDGASERLGLFANHVRETHLNTGVLPTLDLRLLRACLFFEQRKWCKWNWGEEETCPPRVAAYLNDLIRAIRADVAG